MKISSVAAPINNNSNYNINDNNNKCDLYRAFHDPQRQKSAVGGKVVRVYFVY